jgi:hypothetical protein
MDDETKLELVNIRAELQALRLAVNEALSIALSHEANPDKSVILARDDLKKIVGLTRDEMTKKATDSTSQQFALWFVGLVDKSISSLMDEVERRVSQLKRDRALH